MPSLIGTPVAANYQKAQPSTMFGTRELAFLQINLDGNVESGYTNSDSLYAQAIRGLQSVCELYAVGTPNGSWFTAVVAATTAPYNNGQHAQDGNTVSAIENAISATTDTSCTVWNARLNGANIENNC